ncbi:GatB/YqeY domain-containing protein [Candidatus Uhrbacteria bacterium]|nr:GatB/YqeY domain-containing protein [Candidatus Uhrbacteria bacterium]
MTKQDLQLQLKQAMIAKEKLRVSTLRLLLSAIQLSERQGDLHEATPEETVSIIQREVKRRREAIEEYTRASRADLAQSEQQELQILESYLPQQLTTEEVDAIIRETITNTGASTTADFGKVMKEVSVKTRGRADGKLVCDRVKQLLA